MYVRTRPRVSLAAAGTLPGSPAFPPHPAGQPPTSRSMSSPQKYDAIVIGAGQAGVPLSTALAGAGRRTLLVEREHVGGTCINEGCTPTKTMVASARVAYLARRGADYGVRTGEVGWTSPASASVSATSSRASGAAASAAWRRTKGLDLVFGEARFTGPRTLAVDGRTLRGPTWCSSTPAAVPRRPTWRASTAVAAARLDLRHGARPRPRAPHRARRRLYRARVRPDVPPVRQPGDHRPARPPAAPPGGRGRGRRSARHPAGGRGGSPARGCSQVRRAARRPAGSCDRAHGRRGAPGRTAPMSCMAAGRIPNTDRLDPQAAGIDTDARATSG